MHRNKVTQKSIIIILCLHFVHAKSDERERESNDVRVFFYDDDDEKDEEEEEEDEY